MIYFVMPVVVTITWTATTWIVWDMRKAADGFLDALLVSCTTSCGLWLTS